MPKFRYIRWSEYGALANRLVKMLRDERIRLDLIIGVARGGIPLAMVLGDQLGVRLDIINIKSYDGIASRKKPKVVSTLTEEVAGKTVLVVDDLVDEGDTLRTVVKHLSSKNPRSIRTAVLFRKPWSSVTPDYYLETLDEWVVFPWEKGEVERALKKRSPSRLDE